MTSQLWSPVDLLSPSATGAHRPVPAGSSSNTSSSNSSSDHRPGSSSSDAREYLILPAASSCSHVRRHRPRPGDIVDQRLGVRESAEQRNGNAVNGSAPPAAHSGPSHLPPAYSSKNKRHMTQDAGLNSKRPRVRDYTGSRSGSHTGRHLYADLPVRPFPAPLPLVKTSPPNCDNESKDQHAASSSRSSADSECGAPLDLCIKKPTVREPAAPRISFDHQNNRMSGSSSHSDQRFTPHQSAAAVSPVVFPKKRGRKPKSLLMSGLSATPPASASSSSGVHAAAVAAMNENKPRKRGRPPLMSPPPNIGLDTKAMGRGADDFALISNRLQASVFAQQQLAAQNWQSLFPAGGGHPLLLQNSLRDAIAQLSSLHSFPSSSSTPSHPSLPQSSRAASDTHPSARDADSDADSEPDSKDDFRPDLNEEDLRIPLKCGWRRYTIINRISSTGIRGDVLYMSPEGKKLRNLNDIQRYLNKNNPRKLSRDNFSFSCKWFVGEFNQPSQDKQEHQMLSESEVINRIEEMKRMQRKKISMKTSGKRGRRSRESPDAGPSSSSADQRKLEEDILRTQAQMFANFRMDEMKLLDAIQSMHKNNHNQEQEKLKEEEIRKSQAKAKAREIEMKRQQEEQLQKEQEMQKRREMQMMAEIERERRRQHMLMVRNMDLHKRLEERERKREEAMMEKRVAQEKKIQKKRLEMELVKELRKPVDDMRLKDMKPLPTLNRIPGLKLPARAFSEILLVFEFLHNFGETLGYDMDSLPTLNSFQLALLNMDEDSEEELLSVLQHLLVCVIEDPGLPVNVSTGVGQKLKDAPITNFNMSEILRLYFQSIVLHRESAAHSQEGRIYRTLSRNKPFLSLPPTLKAEILAYLCNELLCNQAIVKQIDESMENVATIRKDKWVVDCELRKFRSIQSARERKAQAVLADASNKEDKPADEEEQTEKRETLDEESGDSGAENEENAVANDQDEEPEMTNEEVEKRIEKLSRQCTLMTNKLTKTVHGLRVSCLGQDRYRRRYWVLPAAGGVFVEGLESAEASELQNNIPDVNSDSPSENGVPEESVSRDDAHPAASENGLPDVAADVTETISPIKAETKNIESDAPTDEVADGVPVPDTDEKVVVKERNEDDDVCSKSDALGISPLVASALFGGQESAENNGRKSISLLNAENTVKKENTGHWFTILPRQPCNSTTLVDNQNHDSDVPVEEKDSDAQSATLNGGTPQNGAAEADDCERSPKKPMDVLSHLTTGGCLNTNLLSAIEQLGDICPSLQKKLAAQREEQFDEPQRIPPEFQFGWWRVTDPSQIRSLIEVLHDRGVRERLLHKHLTKILNYVVTKCKSNAVDFEVTELDKKIYEECSFGAPRDAGRYCRDVALRFDIAVIEEIETLEEKISNSSMQVRGWKPTVKIAADPDLRFRRQLADFTSSTDPVQSELADIFKDQVNSDDEDEEMEEDDVNVVDTLSFGKERLLSTEAMIERRYLKPPLGFKAYTVLVSSGSTDELAENAADENAPSGLVRWREAVRECTTSSQLALLLHFLESCIAWDKSIMRAVSHLIPPDLSSDSNFGRQSCQFCHSGENEAQLLLCDGCDKGYHMYCFKPKMEIVPDGDWFCFECQNKNTIDKVCIVCGKKGKLLSCETCPKVFHPNCIDPPVSKLPKGKWSCQICVRKPKKVSKTMARKSSNTFLEEKAAVIKETNKELSSSSSTPVNTKESKRGSSSQSSAAKNRKDSKAEAAEKEVRSVPESRSSAKKDRKSKENSADASGLTACGIILSEMESHEDAWPFKTPVNTKQFPTYKKIIKRPMDLQSMRQKIESGVYKNKSDWNSDVILMFDNCETFNEDESPVGRAGHNLRFFFDKRWKDLFDKCA